MIWAEPYTLIVPKPVYEGRLFAFTRPFKPMVISATGQLRIFKNNLSSIILTNMNIVVFPCIIMLHVQVWLFLVTTLFVITGVMSGFSLNYYNAMSIRRNKGQSENVNRAKQSKCKNLINNISYYTLSTLQAVSSVKVISIQLKMFSLLDLFTITNGQECTCHTFGICHLGF